MKEQDRLEGAPEKAGGSDLAVAAAPVGAPQEEHRRQDPFRVERRHYQRRSEDRHAGSGPNGRSWPSARCWCWKRWCWP